MGKTPHSSGWVIYPLVGMFMLVAVTAQPVESWAYRHHNSRIKYHEYGQKPFDLAKRQDKPVFMVLSAVWCFWCKYYEKRTLEKEPVAEFLNRNFINIFVDLDQRQDLQHLYVKKGIPTTVIFTPEGEFFLSFSGTLGPQEFLTGVRQVLAKMRGRVRPPGQEQAPSVQDIRVFLAAPQKPGAASRPLQALHTQRRREFLELALESFDEEQGGFGQGKKYPLGRLVQYLLEQAGEPDGRVGGDGGESVRVALKLLDQVGRHLYDSVEGGFFRYSDARDWSRPRHEKMLLTNVNLLRAYQLALRVQAGGSKKTRENFRRIYDRSLDFFLKTYVRDGAGGLAGSLDGKNPDYYRLSAAKRAGAKAPTLDMTVYTAWNGEAVHVLVEMYRQQPDPRVLQSIENTLEFLRSKLSTPEEGLYSFYRTRDKSRVGLGQLQDNSWGALAFITGYEFTGKAEYLESFRNTLAYMRKHLFLPALGAYRMWNVPAKGGFRDGEHISDEVPLEANGVMAFALAKAYKVTKDTKYRHQAEALLRSLGGLDFSVFEDDPSDEGRQYLLSIVYYLKALNELAKLDS